VGARYILWGCAVWDLDIGYNVAVQNVKCTRIETRCFDVVVSWYFVPTIPMSQMIVTIPVAASYIPQPVISRHDGFFTSRKSIRHSSVAGHTTTE